MAVLAEFYSVIIRVSTLETHYLGGLEAYAARCPNGTFCSDGEICRIGFMSWADVEGFGESLQEIGFHPEAGAVAVTREDKGLIQPCEWLEFDRIDSTPIATLRGSTSDVLVCPPNWSPGAEHDLTTETELQEKWERIAAKDGVETYRHLRTGEMQYVGRAGSPVGRRRWWWRFWS